MDALTIIANFLLITLLGLLIAFSPVIIAVNTFVVLKSNRPLIQTLVLMAGVAAPLLIVALLASNFIDPNNTIKFGDVASKIKIPPVIYLALGLWLIIVALMRWRYTYVHKKPKRLTNFAAQHPPDKLSALFGFAFVKSALSVTNLFAILVVCELIITHAYKQPLAGLIILWAIVIGLLPFGIILYLFFYRHEKLQSLNVRIDSFLNRDLDFAINLILVVVGTIFAFSSIISELRK